MLDLLDLDPGIILPVADSPMVIDLVLILKSGDFFVLVDAEDLGRNFGLLKIRSADLDLIAVGKKEDIAKSHALLICEQFDIDNIARADSVLLGAGFNDRVHVST